MSTTLTPAWTAPRNISRAAGAEKTDEAALATEVEEARQRALRMSRRLTHGRKSTIGLELKKLELDQIQAQIEDLTDSMKLADQSKRHSRMIKEKLARDAPVASTPVLSSAAEGRRTVMRSIKLSKGWADESPEWQAMSAKEREMEAKEEAERIALEKRAAEVDAQLRRRQKQRQQERGKQQQEQLERLKKHLAELEATLEKEAEDDEAALLAEFERRKAETQTRIETQRRERERQRQEEERIRKEREEALAKRKREIEQRERELQEAVWRKEEERLQADQSRLDRLKSLMDDPSAPVATMTSTSQVAVDRELARKAEEVRAREDRLVEYEKKLEAMAARLQRLPDIEGILKALENMRPGMDPAALFGGAPAAAAGGRKTAEVYKAEIAELQQVLMDANKTPKEIDDANIKLEKLMQEYEKTPEFRAEIERAAQERRARHEKPNAEALARMKAKYNAASVQANPDLIARIAAHPELRILFMESATVLRIHEKDFAGFTLRGLELDELRALAALMPKQFAVHQKLQQAWLQGLVDKIESVAANPGSVARSAPPKKPAAASGAPGAPPRPPAAPRRAAAPAVGGGDIFDEIRRRAGKVAAAPATAASASASPAAPSRPQLPTLAARPPLPPAPKPVATNSTPLPPPKQMAPPPLPAPSAPAAPATGAAAHIQAVQASLERLVKLLAQPQAAHTEKDTASETRTLVSATKQLAEALSGAGKRSTCQALQDNASEMVVAVRSVLVARRAGGQEANAAKAQLVRCIDSLRKLMRDA